MLKVIAVVACAVASWTLKTNDNTVVNTVGMEQHLRDSQITQNHNTVKVSVTFTVTVMQLPLFILPRTLRLAEHILLVIKIYCRV